MTHEGKLILQRRLKQNLGAWRGGVNGLKLRLKFECAETVLLAAATDLPAELGFSYGGIETGCPYEPCWVDPHRCSDLIVSFAERPHHGKRNGQRPIDSMSIHPGQHHIGTMYAPTMQSLAYVAVRIEDREPIPH
jgi:hypothetical protein